MKRMTYPMKILLALLLVACSLACSAAPGPAKHPLYIGVEGCAPCHAEAVIGHQFSIWRMAAHARAYASLAKPASKQIALLSGIPEPPTQAKMCLGCHATAAETEDWERTETFHLEDGLQCEACHGPGSEYATREIMMDREKAVANGLLLPGKDTCMRCHRVKGSHEAVLKKAPFDLETAWRQVAHPIPTKGRAGKVKPTEGAAFFGAKDAGSFKFTGVIACAKCHDSAKLNFQFSAWRQSPHARAYAVLATPKAHEFAERAGLQVDPQNAVSCLQCHTTGAGHTRGSFLEGFHLRDGVQCEACHGPGSEYSPEAVMLDKTASKAAGLQPTSEQTCQPCHDPAKAHGKPFHFAEAAKEIAHPSKPVNLADNPHPKYKTPLNLALTPDGRELWIACESAHTVIILDPHTRQKLAEIPVGGQPHDVTFDPAGRRAFVSNRLDDSVSVVDARERRVIATLEVGDEPHGVLLDRQGKHLYVLNTSVDNISVFDAATLQEVKRLSASRSPWSLALSPDGRQILVTHALSRFVKALEPSLSEVTVIDTERAVVSERRLVPGANLLQGVAWHPSGDYGLITLLRTRNRVPMTKIARGWTISNGLGLVWRDGSVDQVILDQPHLGFGDPADVVITPDGRRALVTSSSTDRVAVIDLEKLVALVRSASPHEREKVLPNHTGHSVELTVQYIATGSSPRGLTCSADGAFAYVANALDDSVTVIDLKKLAAVDRLDLGGPREIDQARWGERLFNSANITFRRMFSCHTCHPDGHIDNVVYDIEPDGIGISPVDNRTLRGVNDMAPYKWEGTNPSLKRQCGPRLSVFFTRLQPFTPEELAAVDYYICTIPRPPNRYRKLGAELTEAQRRGKEVFERTRTNDGREIPLSNRCATCHPPPLFTDGQRHDVGTKQWNDRQGKFDAPHLNNIYDSAPYLHNGMAQSLEEIWTKFNPYDQHGVGNDMTKDQLNDLIEYLKTL
jgi:YVTN family beta-propeller protein